MKIFEKVHCKAYMRKMSDGVHISIYDEYEEDAKINGPFMFLGRKKLSESSIINEHHTVLAEDANGNVIKDLSTCDGDSVPKKYYERVPCEFDGFLVGITRIKTEGVIGTIWVDDPYMEEHGRCYKEATNNPKVGVVYFRNNGKRYVLMDDMEYINIDKPNPYTYDGCFTNQVNIYPWEVTEELDWEVTDETKKQINDESSCSTLMQINDAPTAEVINGEGKRIVRCRDCVHRYSDTCPMLHTEWREYDDDGYIEYDEDVFDNTTDDGYCHLGETEDEVIGCE